MATVFERNPKKTIGVFLTLFGIVCLAAGEIYFRATSAYSIDYYAAPADPKTGVITYPYGEIPINSLGFFDTEFNLKSPRKRIGYIGDSVNYGVGAGYGYRITELVRNASDRFEHWNLSNGIGTSIVDVIENAQKHDPLKIGKLVYLLNLNDLAPIHDHAGARPKQATGGGLFSVMTLKSMLRHVDGLRNRSYLYNKVRFAAKNIFTRLGYEASGYRAIELEPRKNAAKIKLAAKKINLFHAQMKSRNLDFCIVLLPYEMQISKDAAQVYRGHGIRFEKAFENGLPQEIIRAGLNKDIPVLDPRAAFAQKPVGHYFVYNQGDKLDWNHPNRRGHKVIADLILKQNFCNLNPPQLAAGQPPAAQN